MNKIQDIINCYKKIPIYKLLSNDSGLQSLLNDKLLFYTKLIVNTFDFNYKSSNEFINIEITQEIEIEENFKKRTILLFGIKTLTCEVKSIFDDSLFVENWIAIVKQAKGEAF